jgi:hypothetical protein
MLLVLQQYKLRLSYKTPVCWWKVFIEKSISPWLRFLLETTNMNKMIQKQKWKTFSTTIITKKFSPVYASFNLCKSNFKQKLRLLYSEPYWMWQNHLMSLTLSFSMSQFSSAKGYNLQHSLSCGGRAVQVSKCGPWFMFLILIQNVMPWLTRLVAGFPLRWPGFNPRSSHVGSVVDKVALGQVFSEYFSFPCQFSFHQLLHTHHLSSGAGRMDQIVANVPSGLITPQETKLKVN